MLVSSHLMSEMAFTADRLIVVGKGRLIAEGTVDEVVRTSSIGYVRVETAEPRGPATPPEPGRRGRRHRARRHAHRDRHATPATSASSPAPPASPSMNSRRATPPSKRRSWNSPVTPPNTTPVANSPPHAKEQQHDHHLDHIPLRRRHATADPGRSRVLRAAARAEWTKMRSVRSTIWTLLMAIALAIGFGALVGGHPDQQLGHPRPRRASTLRPHVVQPQRIVPRSARRRCARRPADHLRVRHRADPSHPRRHPTTAHGPRSQSRHVRRRRVRRRTGRVVQRLRVSAKPSSRPKESTRHSVTPACCGP